MTVVTDSLEVARAALEETDELHSEEIHLRTATVSFETDADDSYAVMPVEGENVRLSEFALRQLAAAVGVPTAYILKCPAHLQSANIEHWQRQLSENKRNRVVVGQDQIQAITSPNFIPVRNVPLFDTLVEKIGGGDPEKVSLDLFHHDWRLTRLGVTNVDAAHRVETKHLAVVQPDIVRAGANFVNSLVSETHTQIDPVIYRLTCKNSMVAPVSPDEQAFRYSHKDAGNPSDWLAAAIDAIGELYEPIFQQIDEAAKRAFENPERVLRDQLRRVPGPVRQAVLEAYQEEPVPTIWGIGNAFTRAAHQSDAVRNDQRLAIERHAGSYVTDPTICTTCGLPADVHKRH
jgi:hypothetical protein